MVMMMMMMIIVVVSSTTAHNEPLHDCLSLVSIPIHPSIHPSIHPPKVWSPHTPATFEFRIHDSSDHFIVALSL
jgi:hypothetical protein